MGLHRVGLNGTRMEPYRDRIRSDTGDVAQQTVEHRISTHDPCSTDRTGMEHPTALGPFPVDHLRRQTFERVRDARMPVKVGVQRARDTADALRNDAQAGRRLGQRDTRRRVEGHPRQCRSAQVPFVPDGAGQSAAGCMAEGLPAFEPQAVRMVEQWMLGLGHAVDAEILRVGEAPSRGLQADDAGGRAAHGAQLAAARPVLAVELLAERAGRRPRSGLLGIGAARVVLALLHDAHVVIETDPQVHRVA